MVTVDSKIATGTVELSHREWNGLSMPAPGAILRSVAGIHRNILTTSTYSLVRKIVCELSPSRIHDRLCQTVIMNHLVDTQVFNADDTKTVYNPPGLLMSKVVTSISDTLMNMRDHFFSPSSFMSTFLQFRQLSLSFGKSLFICPEESWVVYLLTVRQGRKRSEADINAHSQGGFGKEVQE